MACANQFGAVEGLQISLRGKCDEFLHIDLSHLDLDSDFVDAMFDDTGDAYRGTILLDDHSKALIVAQTQEAFELGDNDALTPFLLCIVPEEDACEEDRVLGKIDYDFHGLELVSLENIGRCS